MTWLLIFLSRQLVKTDEDEKQSGGFFSDSLYHDRAGIAAYIHAKRHCENAAGAEGSSYRNVDSNLT